VVASPCGVVGSLTGDGGVHVVVRDALGEDDVFDIGIGTPFSESFSIMWWIRQHRSRPRP
jgi:hypothetical protein